jgi:hypothetical protein
MFGAYLSLDTPARSAAVYVHQLQKNATIRGSQLSGFLELSMFQFG